MINESSCLLCSVEEKSRMDLKQQKNKNKMKFQFGISTVTIFSLVTVKAINYFHAGHWKDRKLSEMALSSLKG